MVRVGRMKFRPNVQSAINRNQKSATGSLTQVTSIPPSADERNEVVSEVEPLNNEDRLHEKLIPEVEQLSFQSEVEHHSSHCRNESQTSNHSEVEPVTTHHNAHSDSSSMQSSCENETQGPQGKENFPTPRLMVDANGEVVVDEDSLYIVQILPDEAVEEEDIPKRRTTPKWSKSDTEVFYRALKYTGLNFPVLAVLLKKWSEAEIKAKYKREMKQRYDHVFNILRMKRDMNFKVGTQKITKDGKVFARKVVVVS